MKKVTISHIETFVLVVFAFTLLAVFLVSGQYTYVSSVPTGGHSAENVWVAVDGVEMTLQDAITQGKFGPAELPECTGTWEFEEEYYNSGMSATGWVSAGYFDYGYPDGVNLVFYDYRTATDDCPWYQTSDANSYEFTVCDVGTSIGDVTCTDVKFSSSVELGPAMLRYYYVQRQVTCSTASDSGRLVCQR
ncbi:hypothetical protein KY337_04675 [Candidatus Woesearchaeota archaeon]|nr:hypothetical protein [Candidatus Woesearchaeota archaeon]